jgi:hypothetical protein
VFNRGNYTSGFVFCQPLLYCLSHVHAQRCRRSKGRSLQKSGAAKNRSWKDLTGLATCGILRELSKTRQSLIPGDQAPVSFHAPAPR